MFVCALGLAVLFGLDLGICGDFSLVLFILLTSFVILLGAVANLATVVNTIAIERDWIVVVANKNEDILAGETSGVRIRSCCVEDLGEFSHNNDNIRFLTDFW